VTTRFRGVQRLLQIAALVIGACAGVACGDRVEYDQEGRPTGLWHRLVAKQPRIDVVVLAVDTLRADSLGVYGGEPGTSPYLDAFARSGTVFENAVASAPMTLVSFSSILTGLYAPAHQVVRKTASADERLVTLAELMAAGGYRTAGFTAGGYLRPQFNLHQGFETYRGKSKTRLISESVDHARSWLQEIGDERFFLFVHGFDPHRPYRPANIPQAPQDYAPPGLDLADRILERLDEGGSLDEFTPGELRIAYQTVDLSRKRGYDEIFRSHQKGKAPIKEIANQGWHESPGFEQDLRWLRSLYDAEVRSADQVVGDFLRFLEDTDRMDETLVVFLSDHGDAFMETMTMGHSRSAQGITHVPLIIRPPPSLEPTPAPRVSTVVRGIDVLPTVLDYAGYPAPVHCQGRSLRPLIAGRELPELPAVTFGAWHVEDAARLGSYKVILRRGSGRELIGDRLHDLAVDPWEQLDIKNEQPQIFARLMEQLEATREESAAIGSRYGTEIELSDETIEALRQLGYVARPEDDVPRSGLPGVGAPAGDAAADGSGPAPELVYPVRPTD